MSFFAGTKGLTTEYANVGAEEVAVPTIRSVLESCLSSIVFITGFLSLLSLELDHSPQIILNMGKK